MNTAPVSAMIVIRHGKTSMNDGPDGERVRGWSDVSLSTEGKLMVAKTAEHLKGLPVTHIIHSDLRRTTQSARIVHEVCRGASMTPSAQCRTWDTGNVEGKLVEDVLPVLKFYFEHPNEKPPGGESYKHFYRRWSAKLKQGMKYLERHPGEIIVYVVHSYNICALEHILCGGCTRIDNKCSVPPGSPIIVEFKEGKYKLVVPVKATKIEVKA